MHQLAELNGTAEIARRRHDEREHHGGLAKADGEPSQVFLTFDQRQIVAQNLGESQIKLGALHRLAFVQCDGLAVFAHPNHVVAKVGFEPLLLEVELDQRAANVVADDAANSAIKNRRPHHEARNVEIETRDRERKVATQAPQDADEAEQCDHRIHQPHGQRDGVAGELVDVFLNPLVRIVRIGGHGTAAAGLRVTCQLHAVERVLGQPALQVVVRHPGAPAQLQQLGQVELVDRNDDEAKRQVGEAAQLRPEHGGLLVLQRVVKHAVPVVDQHQHVHGTQIERDYCAQQGAGLPFLF